MIIFKIQRDHWCSGKSTTAFLYNADKKEYSTLGFLLKSLDVDDYDMDLYMYPSSLVQRKVISFRQIPNLVELLVDSGMANMWDDTEKALQIIKYDETKIQDREITIYNTLYDLGYKIEYE